MCAQNRLFAINAIAERLDGSVQVAQPVSLACFGEDAFNADSMCKHLSKAVVAKLLATIQKGTPLDPAIAPAVAQAMKEWAIGRGATHYTHWFQPLNGGTAEKHDAFLEITPGGKAVMDFSAKNLILGEPDASSLPSGGLRSTFEARGYTAWDPTSPAFIKRHANGATLCIPTVFCSYTGQVLDKKTPLLRSIQALKKSVARLVEIFGLPADVITITLGAEQEFFLIDKRFYLQRPDLVQTGRSLFGAAPPRHQQLEDHYFGAIKPRILAFMTDVEHELWRLGIPAKTRHNEVAPAQFEIVPMFEELNLAVDHNMLVMEVLRQVADRNGLVCLLHEKPFAGINGSGKHNNWSINHGDRNLLDPGNDPHENALFLTILTAVIRAIDLHSDLLRAATSGAGNDHRLGANEAPPAVTSIFLGDQLTDVIKQLERGAVTVSKRADAMRVGVDLLPTMSRDVTDRNRTSPFAFTGNKFEFRAPGASQSCASANTILNTIVAESLDFISDQLEKISSDNFHAGLQDVLKTIIKEHKRVIFNGDNYSEEWGKEAEKRGLPNLRTTMDALKPLLKGANQKLMAKYGVFTKEEMNSRYDVFMEEYHRKVRIEGGVALEIARSMIVPVVTEEFRKVVFTLRTAQGNRMTYGVAGLRNLAEKLGRATDKLIAATSELEAALEGKHEGILAAMAQLRQIVDLVEHLVDDQAWPLPKYREMLFIY